MHLCDERAVIGHIPLRRCEPQDGPIAGTILFYHGLGVDIGIQTPELHSLARAGFRVIGIDAVGHGARRWPDFDTRFAPPTASHNLARVLEASVAELPGLIDALVDRGLADPQRLGLGGISMGAYITYGAALVEPRLSVITPILGSPVWPEGATLQPHTQPEAFFPRALLSVNADDDEVVAPHEARDFHHRLSPHYRTQPQRLSHLDIPHAGHFVPEAAWHRLWAQVLDWYGRFLPAP